MSGTITRTTRCGWFLVLLAMTTGCRSQAKPDGAAAPASTTLTWPTPSGWKQEAFALPPDFAPSFPYRGREELRFAPGFYQTTASDYWSYDIVWWLDSPPAFDSATVSNALTTYYRGLSQAVGGAKYHFDSTHFATTVSASGSGDSARFIGQVTTYDPFTTGRPLTLDVEASQRRCSAHVAVILLVSPRPPADRVWGALRQTAAALACP